MRLLLDTDAFCALAMGGLLYDAVDLLGTDLADCGRLPALPYMLRKGRLRRALGSNVCDTLIPITHQIPVMAMPSDAWLDRLRPIEAIDAGEALIFAAAAEHGMMMISGDKRALHALKDVTEFVGALAERIVVLEAILIALCDHMEPEKVRRKIQPLMAVNKVIRVCFSPGNANPHTALMSYYDALVAKLSPLVLWNPTKGDER